MKEKEARREQRAQRRIERRRDGMRERSMGAERYREGGKRGEQLQASFFSKSFLMKKECFLSAFELNLMCTACRGLE